MDDHGSEVLRALLDAHPEAVLATQAPHGEATVLLRPDALVPVMRWLRDESGLAFELLVDLTAVDHLGPEETRERGPRFEVVYHLASPVQAQRLRVKLPVDEHAPELPSLCAVWPAADWLEREAFDLYGLRFSGHPGLRRILLPEGFVGHPLRKDHSTAGPSSPAEPEA